MGGRGAGSKLGKAAVAVAAAGATQAVTPSGYTFDDLKNMDDKTLHDFLIDANNADMPDFLNTHHTQKMVYQLGMNDKPETVSQGEFDSLVAKGNTVIYRTVNDNGMMSADDIIDSITDGDLSYMGNGVHGDGLYFSNSLRGSKAYGYSGSKTMGAVLNSKAKVIDERQLKSEYDSFVQTHPQTRKALGFARSNSTHNSYSQFALSQGYNVIRTNEGGGEHYFVVLDRSALTTSKKRY